MTYLPCIKSEVHCSCCSFHHLSILALNQKYLCIYVYVPYLRTVHYMYILTFTFVICSCGSLVSSARLQTFVQLDLNISSKVLSFPNPNFNTYAKEKKILDCSNLNGESTIYELAQLFFLIVIPSPSFILCIFSWIPFLFYIKF